MAAEIDSQSPPLAARDPSSPLHAPPGRDRSHAAHQGRVCATVVCPPRPLSTHGYSSPQPWAERGAGCLVRIYCGELSVAPCPWGADATESRLRPALWGVLCRPTHPRGNRGHSRVRLRPGARGALVPKGVAVPRETVSLPCVGDNRFLGMAWGFLGGVVIRMGCCCCCCCVLWGRSFVRQE